MHRLAVYLVCPLCIAGCTAGSDGGSHLSGSTWSFERIDGERPTSEAASLSFSGDEIGVHVGCNRLGGPWRMGEQRLIAGPFTQTEMACPAPAWNQERAVSSLLVAAPRIAIDGDRMILQSSGHTAELVRREKAAGREGR
ncbi:MAG TPA: META domain-containing protein [Novosphingobium sp.]|nr:META domain-containing protein [Novosphingobium sp.]